MDALKEMATLAGGIAGGIVAAAAIVASVYALYRRTVGRRADRYRRLSRLGTNAQLSYFAAILGAPPAMRRRLVLTGSDGAASETRFVNCVWVDAWYFVSAIIDDDETVQGFAVTQRDKHFRPRFRSVASEKARPVLTVQLGKTVFAKTVGRPWQFRSWLGARRFGYVETFYLGNPGMYQTFGLALNDAGFIARFSAPLPNASGSVRPSPDPAFDDGEIRRVREGTIVNSWIVLARGVAEADLPLVFWPDKDELRTFA